MLRGTRRRRRRRRRKRRSSIELYKKYTI